MLSMPRIVRPDLFHFCGTEIGSPVEPATRRFIKRNKELPEFLTESSRVKKFNRWCSR
jgi:hypothetical protein